MVAAMLLKGVALGIAVAAPVGPIGLLRVQRTLRQGAPCRTSGLGVAVADALYAAGAGFTMATLSAFMVEPPTPLQLIGGLAFIGLGLRSLSTARLRCALEDSRPPTRARSF